MFRQPTAAGHDAQFLTSQSLSFWYACAWGADGLTEGQAALLRGVTATRRLICGEEFAWVKEANEAAWVAAAGLQDEQPAEKLVQKLTEEQRRAAAAQREAAEAAAAAAAREAPHIVLGGLSAGAPHADKMGAYALVPDKIIAGRAVWQASGGADRFVYYAPACKQWFVSDRADMKAGATNGWMYVESTGLVPHQATAGTWRLAKGAEKESCASEFADPAAVGLPEVRCVARSAPYAE
jgi:hypothetical protein